MPSRPFDPQRDGFTFPNSWTLNDETLNEIHQQLSNAVDAIFPLLPFPLSAPLLRQVIQRTVNQWVSSASTLTYGLCGGMAFAALDYYIADCPRPTEETLSDNIPPELRSYILRRMRDSFLSAPDTFHPNNVSRVLEWMVIQHRMPGGLSRLLGRTREECKKLNDHIAQYGAWPIALIGEAKDPCKNHQVLAVKCPCQAGDDQTVVSIYDVNYPGPGYDLHLDFRGVELKAEIDHPNNRPPSSWEPLRALFCEEYTYMRPDP